MSDKDTDQPGREIPKEYREIAIELVDNQGWRYVLGSGHPKLYAPNGTSRPIPVPTTPGDGARTYKNTLAQIRRAGGIWPAPQRS